MPFGLQTFDDKGVLVVDLTTRLCTYLGYKDVLDGVDGSMNISIPNNTRFFYSVIPLENMSPYYYPADAKYENGVLQWKFLGNINSNFKKLKSRIIYGYY